jgi:REP element-mobilizing transposase RayT
MPSTFGSAHYHLVFATKERRPLIDVAWRTRLHHWLAGAVLRSGATPLEVGGVGDHVHLVAGLRPSHSLAEVMQDWKRGTSRWVHEELGLPLFSWQEGYAYFTLSQSAVPAVREYVRNQEEHHRRVSFVEEMERLFRENGVEKWQQ